MAREAVAAALPSLGAGAPPRIGYLGPIVALGIRAEADLARAARSQGIDAEFNAAVAGLRS